MADQVDPVDFGGGLGFFGLVRLVVDPHHLWLFQLLNLVLWLSEDVDGLLLVAFFFDRAAWLGVHIAYFGMVFLHMVVNVVMPVLLFIEEFLNSYFETIFLHLYFAL